MQETVGQHDRYSDLVSIRRAAKALGVRQQFVSSFAKARGLYVLWPGYKHGKVPLSELRAALAEPVKPARLDARVKC